MSKFQKEVNEYKKQIQQSGGAFYGDKSSSIAKPSWMNKPVKPVDKPVIPDKPFNVFSNPLNGRKTIPHFNEPDILHRDTMNPILGHPMDKGIEIGTVEEGMLMLDELLPLLRGFML
jgi:hypothetical protein